MYSYEYVEPVSIDAKSTGGVVGVMTTYKKFTREELQGVKAISITIT
jgi:hypothetical protein